MTRSAPIRLLLVFALGASAATAQKPRARDLGVPFDGAPGRLNAITDVPGVEVGYATLIKGGFLFEVVPVNGEEYKALKLKRGGGKLSVSPKEGAAITHEYPAVTD